MLVGCSNGSGSASRFKLPRYLERLERDEDRFDEQMAVTLAEIDNVIEDLDSEVVADAAGVARLAAENLGLTIVAGAIGLFLATVVTISASVPCAG
jgi:hypothetical protein